MSRTLLITGAFAALLLVAGCGGDGAAAPSGPVVRVELTGPRDQAAVRADGVDVRGTVRPADAEVLVGGERATVAGGTFRAHVTLEAGVNVIDVMASAGDARPALTALRVRRITTVAVPSVLGRNQDDATARLQAAGLKAAIHKRGGFFDGLLGGDPVVCSTDPAAGAEVAPGSTVDVDLARDC